MVKEIALRTSFGLGKLAFISKNLGPLLGRGILATNGPTWAHQRKIIAPELYLDKVKGMVSLMVEATNLMLRRWESRIENEAGGVANIRADKDMTSLSQEILSRACFAGSYSQGEQIFSKIKFLLKLMAQGHLQAKIPFLRYLPTKNNSRMWKLKKEIDLTIMKVLEARVIAKQEVKELLQLTFMVAMSQDNDPSSTGALPYNEFIVVNCKNLYLAGSDTAAIAATWTLVLLAAHPDWQNLARAEVLQTCKDGLPDAEQLRSMKTLTMVIQEALCLYPPSVFLGREALEALCQEHGVTLHVTKVGSSSSTVPRKSSTLTLISCVYHHADLALRIKTLIYVLARSILTSVL